jgi:hypothetical protein
MTRLRNCDVPQLTLADAAGSVSAPTAFAKGAPTVPEAKTEVRRHRSQPNFFVDEPLCIAPGFQTYMPEATCFLQFTQVCRNGFCFLTNLGPGFGTPTWLGPYQWNLKDFAQPAHRVLAANPRGFLLPRFCNTISEWRGMPIPTSARCRLKAGRPMASVPVAIARRMCLNSHRATAG